MSSPEKIREDLEEIKSELGGMGERLKTSANEGNWHISPSAGGGVVWLTYREQTKLV